MPQPSSTSPQAPLPVSSEPGDKTAGETGLPECPHAVASRFRPVPEFLEWLASEPFRIFFPLGALASVGGVLLWPLFYGGFLRFHPAWAHARVMIECSLGAYIFGFLGTALPRMLEVAHLRPPEAMILVGIWAASFALHLSGRTAAGDTVFLLLAFSFCVWIILRWAGSRAPDVPAGFWIAAAGVLCGVAGAAILLIAARFPVSSFVRRFGELLLYQGFPLLPMLGIGGFLFGRFFPGSMGSTRAGLSPEPSDREWVLFCALAAGILISFVAEAAGWERSGNALRFLLVAGFLLGFTRVFRRTKSRGTLACALRCGLVCLLGGLAARAAWPSQRIALEHVLLVGGFGLVVFTVGSRVVLGHAGRAGLFFAKHRPLLVIAVLVLLAMVTRVSADFLPRSLVSHHNYAALLWALSALVWIGWLARWLARPDPDTDRAVAKRPRPHSLETSSRG